MWVFSLNFKNMWHSFLTNTRVREQNVDHTERTKLKVTMQGFKL